MEKNSSNQYENEQAGGSSLERRLKMMNMAASIALLSTKGKARETPTNHTSKPSSDAADA
jgi:hypothetical protein